MMVMGWQHVLYQTAIWQWRSAEGANVGAAKACWPPLEWHTCQELPADTQERLRWPGREPVNGCAIYQ